MALQENRHHPIPSNDLSLFSLLYSHKIRGYPYGSVCQWGTPTGNGNFIWSIRSWTIRKNGAIILHRAPWGPWPPSPSALPQLGGCQVGMSSTGQPRLGATDLLQALPDPKEILLQGTGELVFLLNSY